MGAYEYQALDQRGRETKGVIQGDTARQARQILRDQGLSPLSVNPVTERPDGTKRRRGRLKAAELALMIRQLASLSNAGLPVEESLATVVEQSEKPSVKRIVAALRSKVMEGHALSAGMAEFPGAFPPLFRATVAAGEQSGRLDDVLSRLADYAETREELGRKVLAALVYPIILAIVAMLVVFGLMVYVVPQVVQVFDSLNQTLPPLTRGLIAVSDFLANFGLWTALASFVLVLSVSLILRAEGPRRVWHRTLLRLPIAGRLARGINTARFTRTLSILTASAVPLLESMGIAREVVSNLPMRAAIAEASSAVREGSSMHRALERSRLFPPLVLRLIASGEKGGELDDMLRRSAENQEREVETSVGLLVAVLEPLMILAVGTLVLTIVLAILLPIFQMNQLIR